ncbi:Cell-death-related nuclease 7 [Toxocara canis]|uniref:Cell-death-related nuclease 7 n=1 Tax=Toxocara canis TaxID=6265 RepID=A0A0B2W4P7_TOXCA|nr:Cell-death-related nuclease 7 [Toxocara canis]
MLSYLVCFSMMAIFSIVASVSCRDSSGDSVDWFVGYKLPLIESDRSSLSGLSFLYADGRSISWSLPQNISSNQSAIGYTLSQLYSTLEDMGTFYMLYNDDHPGNGKVDPYRGHAKGVVVFNGDSGFWLIHSVPNFPATRQYLYPSSGLRNGQSFLCISMKTDSLSSLATQMLYIQPSIYLSQLPNEFASRYPDLQKVIGKKSLNKTAKVFYSVAQLVSQSGVQFTSFAKHKKFEKDIYSELLAPKLRTSLLTETWLNGPDIYSELLAPKLRTSLLTETWLNGPGDLPSSCSSTYKVNNIVSVLIDGKQFKSSKDHSKWAVSADKRNPMLCIGDINRQKSQSKRGGGTVCIRNAQLWHLYNGSVDEIEPCRSVASRPNWLTRLWKLVTGIFGNRN